MRSEVEAALEEPDGRSRLLAVAGRYIDDEGNWPTDRATNEFLARQFVQSTNASVGRRFGGAGLSQTTVAGLAGGAISVGASKGAVILGSNLLANYWQESMAYATGLSPSFYSAVFTVFKKITKGTHWEQLAKDLTGTSGPSSFDMVFGNGYEKMLEKELLGVFSKTAWRGARSAANHFAGTVGSHGTENGWIQNYVKVFATSQKNLTERTISAILAEGAEQALSERLMAGRLKMLWGLTPRHAKAVENYRRGLASQDRTPASIHKLVQRYADRLQRSRIKALSDTEVLTAFNLSRERQWVSAVNSGEMPIDTMKMWVTAKDELVCKVCRPLDGQVAPLGQAFESKLITIYAPAAHPNCRCIIVPVRTSVANFGKDHTFIFPGTELVEKRTIVVSEYERADGTVVEAHTRGGSGKSEDGYSEKWTNSPLADDWVRWTTKDLRDGVTAEQREFLNDIITAPVIPELYRGVHNDGLGHSDFDQRKVKKALKKWTTTGKTFELPLSSFTTEDQAAYGYARNRGTEPGIMFVLRDARGIKVNASKSDEYKDDAFVEAVNARNEVVTRGKFRVGAVVDGPGGVTLVAIEQVDIPEVKKRRSWWFSKSDQDVERWLIESLSTPLGSRDEIEKRLIRVESYEKEDGTKVDAHFRNLEGEDRSEDLRKLKDGGYDMPLSWLRNHIRGSGIRLGQNNRVRSLANSIIENGFTKPITMWVYDDGPFIKDGMHRLEAANMIGFERIPVAIMHVEGNKPKTDIRGRLAARRIRNQTPQQRVDTPFKNVKQEQRFVRWFNNRMSNRGERIAEGEEPPRRKRRPLSKADDRPVLFEIEKHLIGQHDQDTHGRDKHTRMDFGGSSGSDALYAAGAAALAIGLRKLGAGEILNKAFKLKSVRPTKAPKYDAADEMAALEAHRAKSVTDDIWLDTDTWKLGLSEDLAALRTAPNYAIAAKVQTSTAMFKDALRTATGRSEDLFEEMGAMTMSTKHVSSIGRTKAAEPVNLKSLREAMSKHHALNDDVNNLTRRVDRMKLAEESDEYFKFSHTARQYTGYFEEAKKAREYMQSADAVSDPALDRFFAAIAEAPKVNRPLYRGVQMPTNSAKGQQWMRPGETFELPISSFSDDFVSARGYSGGVSAAPKANHNKIVFRLQDAHGLDVSDHAQITQSMTQREFVTAGKFKVANVKNMDDGVTLVDLVQESVIDFAEDWSKIGFGKSGLFGIEKHLIGRHDQKTHGRDEHGGQNVVENVSDFVQYGSDEVDLTSGQELALYGAAGIVSRVFFKQAVPLATVKSIKNPVQVLKRSKDFHGGLWTWVNKGSSSFRMVIEGTKSVGGKHRRQMIAFADGLDQLAKVPSPRVLHRGMVIPKSSKSASEIKSFSLTANDLKVGHSFDLAPSSFTTSKQTAKFFSKDGSTKHGDVAVLLRVDRGHRSARVADVSPMPWEREYVGWGSYQITKVTKKSGHVEVRVKQTETYSLGDAIRKGIAKSDASGAPKAPSTGKYSISPASYQALATGKSADDLLASAKDAKKGGFKAAADEWEKMAEMKASGVPTTKPKLSDFDDQVEWLNALHDWQKMFLNSA